MLALTFPVLISLLAEPLMGLVDTFFVAQLGAVQLGALAIATVLFSSASWVFNFVGIATQTDVARADGAHQRERGAAASGRGVALGFVLGAGFAAASWWVLEPVTAWMGAQGEIQHETLAYLRLRLFGAPAMLILLAGFGALRGLQDMNAPLRIALASNALNAALDPLLIFGAGPLPALGVSGAAIATTVSQWLAAIWVMIVVRRRFGSLPLSLANARGLLIVGRDMVIRTGLLVSFQLLATRKAALIGVSAVAAHQVVRQIWMFSAFLLDAYATAAQSLVSGFLGAGRIDLARRVAGVSFGWGITTGVGIMLAMLATEGAVLAGFVPAGSELAFHGAWLALAMAQPLNAVSFVTDGLHWGSADYGYLRNGMIAATAIGALGLVLLDSTARGALSHVWIVTAVWIAVRAAAGTLRIWPGIGRSPYRG